MWNILPACWLTVERIMLRASFLQPTGQLNLDLPNNGTTIHSCVTILHWRQGGTCVCSSGFVAIDKEFIPEDILIKCSALYFRIQWCGDLKLVPRYIFLMTVICHNCNWLFHPNVSICFKNTPVVHSKHLKKTLLFCRAVSNPLLHACPSWAPSFMT